MNSLFGNNFFGNNKLNKDNRLKSNGLYTGSIDKLKDTSFKSKGKGSYNFFSDGGTVQGKSTPFSRFISLFKSNSTSTEYNPDLSDIDSGIGQGIFNLSDSKEYRSPFNHKRPPSYYTRPPYRPVVDELGNTIEYDVSPPVKNGSGEDLIIKKYDKNNNLYNFYYWNDLNEKEKALESSEALQRASSEASDYTKENIFNILTKYNGSYATPGVETPSNVDDTPPDKTTEDTPDFNKDKDNLEYDELDKLSKQARIGPAIGTFGALMGLGNSIFNKADIRQRVTQPDVRLSSMTDKLYSRAMGPAYSQAELNEYQQQMAMNRRAHQHRLANSSHNVGNYLTNMAQLNANEVGSLNRLASQVPQRQAQNISTFLNAANAEQSQKHRADNMANQNQLILAQAKLKRDQAILDNIGSLSSYVHQGGFGINSKLSEMRARNKANKILEEMSLKYDRLNTDLTSEQNFK